MENMEAIEGRAYGLKASRIQDQRKMENQNPRNLDACKGTELARDTYSDLFGIKEQQATEKAERYASKAGLEKQLCLC